MKLVQQGLVAELKIRVQQETGKTEIIGKFKRLAPFKDELGIWRVGVRLREFTPFTIDNKPPVLLPHEHRFTFLAMREAHSKKHGGIQETVSQFRLDGYWTANANKLARKIKSTCVTCRYLDRNAISQIMG